MPRKSAQNTTPNTDKTRSYSPRGEATFALFQSGLMTFADYSRLTGVHDTRTIVKRLKAAGVPFVKYETDGFLRISDLDASIGDRRANSCDENTNE